MERRTGFEYTFDPQKHVRRRIVSTQERGNQLPRAKNQKNRCRRKSKPTERKNRPYQNVKAMNLQCCTENTCLLNHGRQVIKAIRKDFDSKLYDEQNCLLVSLIDIELRNKRNKITYNIRGNSGLDKVKVCKTAFLKIFGIGKKRIQILLNKIQPFSGRIQEDQRRYNRNQNRIPLALKAEVYGNCMNISKNNSL